MFNVEPNDGTTRLEDIIVAAIEKWITALRDDPPVIVAAAADSELWATLYGADVGPALGAEFIATAATNAPDTGIAATDGLLAWPPGVDGPPTVQALLDAYPATFAGVTAAQVTFVVASPVWTQKFAQYMAETENLIKGMAETVFAEMQTALSKTGASATLFDKQKAVREFLSWEGEGGYVGWMRRAERIARTETAIARNHAAFAAALETMNAGVPVSKRWNAVHDARTRPEHAAAHGQTRDLTEPFNVGGEPLMFPGDRENGSASATINCRCTPEFFENMTAEEIEEESRWLDSLNGKTLDDIERMLDGMDNALVADGATIKGLRWEGQLAPVGEPTGDRRIFTTTGEFRYREFPLPLLWQESTSDGHDSSRIVGTIESGEVTDTGFVAKGVIFSDEEKLASLVEAGVVRPSVDLCDMVAEEVPGDDGDEFDTMLSVTSATIMAATLVAKPAFERVGIAFTGESEDITPNALVASAGAVALDRYDAAAFDDPHLDKPTAVTVTEQGRVFGHLALWDTCHVGVAGKCQPPPRSQHGYSAFHQSTAYTDAGPIAVGRLTVGGGHAGMRAGARQAAEHYDQTGTTWAMVRAGEDEHGIWIAGQVHPEATTAQINAGASSPLSGDWRQMGAGMELVAALSVNVPGFPVRREYTTEQGYAGALVATAGIIPDREVQEVGVLTNDQLDTLATRLSERLAAKFSKPDAEPAPALWAGQQDEFQALMARRRGNTTDSLAVKARESIAAMEAAKRGRK